jgi:aldehyde dehydrogenase (NAD+)
LVILPFEDEEDAIRIANDSPFGLAGHVHTNDPDRAQRVARALDAGMIGVNGQGQGVDAPFGGFKMSGVGREGSDWGLYDFLEIKAVTGLAI